MRINKFSWTLLVSRAVSHGIFPSISLNQGCDLFFCLVSSSQDSERCQLMVTAAKATPELHIPDWLFLVSKYEVLQGIFPCWLPDYLRWDVVINALQKFPGLFVLHYIGGSADTRICKHEVSSSYLKDSSCIIYPNTC